MIEDFLIVFAFEEEGAVDVEEAVEAAVGEGDVPLGAVPGMIRLPPVSARRPGAESGGDFAADVFGPEIGGAVGGEFDPCGERRAETAERQAERWMQCGGGGGGNHEGGSGEREGVGPVGVDGFGRADAVRADDGHGAGECFGEAVGIAKAGFE